MDRMKRLLWLVFLVSLMAVPDASAKQEQQEEAVLVGRISYVEGELLRYVSSNEDWVSTVKDTPIGIGDVLYSDENARAEFIIPNNTWIRIGGSTQIEIIRLESDLTEVDVTLGKARFYNKSSSNVIKAATPFGNVVAPPIATFDLYVGDESVQVVALQGKVKFVHITDDTEYEVIAGSSSILAGYQEITSTRGIVGDDWDSWNLQRDSLWRRRLEVKGDSVKYLPKSLNYEADTLENNGVWERVYYEGRYRYFWRPIYVSSSWAPFTEGRWTVWYGDNCWVPHEPFGYITHHYGNWVYVNRCRFWYWAPPVHRVKIGRGPFLNIGIRWYPGRVSWIYRDGYIGWIPLAPFERYYCRRYWGPRSVMVNKTSINIKNINVNNYCYKDHAVIIKQKDFYDVDNYRRVRIRNITRKTIIDGYHGAAVVDNRAVKNFRKIRNRFNFRNIDVKRKPHRSVIKRIRQKRLPNRQSVDGRGGLVRERVERIERVKPAKRAYVRTPKTTHKIKSVREANKPVKRTGSKMLHFNKRRTDIKKTRARQGSHTKKTGSAIRSRAK